MTVNHAIIFDNKESLIIPLNYRARYVCTISYRYDINTGIYTVPAYVLIHTIYYRLIYSTIVLRIIYDPSSSHRLWWGRGESLNIRIGAYILISYDSYRYDRIYNTTHTRTIVRSHGISSRYRYRYGTRRYVCRYQGWIHPWPVSTSKVLNTGYI